MEELKQLLATRKFRRSELAEKLIRFEGKPFSLSNGYDFYKDIYDVDPPTLLLVNARQTGKTLSVANFITINSVAIPFHKSLYISPTQNQTSRFSLTKLAKVYNGSPLLKYFFQGDSVNNVFLKVLRNMSEVTLSYAGDDADRVRGVTCDAVSYDEAQDIDLATVMPIADSCMDASPKPRKTVTGTPKSVENPMEEMWQRSTQTHLLIRCEACKIWNKPSLKNIGLKGFICAKCGRTLNVRNCAWKDFNPGSRIKGYHIPQIVVPAHTENPEKWDILLDKFNTYPQAKFKNEIMAESDSAGTRMITKDDIAKCCHDYTVNEYPRDTFRNEFRTIVGGVDWGGNGKDGTSRTVLWIWGITPNMRYKTLYFKIYPSVDPIACVDDIAVVCDRFGVQMLIGDSGEGQTSLGLLTIKLGKHRVGRAKYGMHAKVVDLDKDTGCYKLNKTDVIDNFLLMIKNESVIFPNEFQMATPIEDILAEFSETTSVGKKVWKRSLSKPDDCLHAMIFGNLAGRLLTRDLNFI